MPCPIDPAPEVHCLVDLCVFFAEDPGVKLCP